MKGTLFSADFVNDSNNNLKLLELNTDTAFTSASLHHADFSGLINILSASNISEVHVIYKDVIHKNFIEELSQSLHESSLNVSYNLYPESFTTIYPTTVTDSDDKFILRLAYDESAIFDSTYCKQDIELLKLFYDNNNSGSVPEMYHSSSTYQIDTLLESENTTNVPDLVVKNIINPTTDLKLYKLIGTGSLSNKYSAFISSSITSDDYVINYYETPNSTKSKSYRSFNIIYGTDLNILNLANLEVVSLLDEPSSLTIDTGSGLVDDKHYYEFTTNYPKFNGIGGIFEDEDIVDDAGNVIKIKDAVIGNSYKSIFIEGAPDSDSYEVFTDWSHVGSSFPSGSFVTSSVLVSNTADPLPKKMIMNLETADSSSIRLSPNQHLLIYDSIEDKLRYKLLWDLDINNDRLIGGISGSVVAVSSNDIQILNEEYNNYISDFESVDTFLLHNGDINIKVVTHNCFPKGTRILLNDGTYKNIEDLTTDDVLLTYNHEKGKYGAGRFGSIRVSTQNELVHILTENSDEIKSTPLHRFYVEDAGWVHAKDIKVGDSLFNKDGHLVKVKSIESLKGEFEVYHIIDVKNDNTYFAEDVLVHNQKIIPSCFIAGTEISLSNGDVKNIEDIVVGEEVLTYNEESKKNEVGVVGNLKESRVDSIIRITLDNEIIIHTTSEHPFYVNGKGWIKASEIEVLDTCKKVNGEESLVSTVEVLEETHVVYNLLSVSENHNFYANGILVHNK